MTMLFYGGSETTIYERHLAAMQAVCPVSQDWEVLELADVCLTSATTTAILNFLGEVHPQAILENLTVPSVYFEDQREEPGGGAGLPARRLRIQEDVWAGRLRVRWEGAEILLHRVRLMETSGNMNLRTIVATTDREALHHLVDVAVAHHRGRMARKREIFVVNGRNIPRSKDGWDTLVLPSGMVDEIRRAAEAFFESEGRYLELGIPYRRGFLFVGPPGNGKTQTVRVLAATFPEAAVVTVHIRADLEDDDVIAAFDFARTFAPAILVLEDLDKIQQSAGVSLSNLLNLLDGLDAWRGVLIVATTNEPGQLDAALLKRPSRFDRVWEFPLPDLDRRRDILLRRGGRFFPDALLEQVAGETEGFSMAYVQEVVVTALLDAIHEGVPPQPRHLEDSLEVILAQFRAVGRGCEKSMKGIQRVGFEMAVRRRDHDEKFPKVVFGKNAARPRIAGAVE